VDECGIQGPLELFQLAFDPGELGSGEAELVRAVAEVGGDHEVDMEVLAVGVDDAESEGARRPLFQVMAGEFGEHLRSGPGAVGLRERQDLVVEDDAVLAGA
jgi:hypothetical protein